MGVCLPFLSLMDRLWKLRTSSSVCGRRQTVLLHLEVLRTISSILAGLPHYILITVEVTNTCLGGGCSIGRMCFLLLIFSAAADAVVGYVRLFILPDCVAYMFIPLARAGQTPPIQRLTSPHQTQVKEAKEVHPYLMMCGLLRNTPIEKLAS